MRFGSPRWRQHLDCCDNGFEVVLGRGGTGLFLGLCASWISFFGEYRIIPRVEGMNWGARPLHITSRREVPLIWGGDCPRRSIARGIARRGQHGAAAQGDRYGTSFST